MRSEIGFLGLMFLLFLGLKLGGVIHWSWWWVTAPLWSIPALVAWLGLIVGVCALVAVGITSYFKKD